MYVSTIATAMMMPMMTQTTMPMTMPMTMRTMMPTTMPTTIHMQNAILPTLELILMDVIVIVNVVSMVILAFHTLKMTTTEKEKVWAKVALEKEWAKVAKEKVVLEKERVEWARVAKEREALEA
jgi:cell division protein FtsL